MGCFSFLFSLVSHRSAFHILVSFTVRSALFFHYLIFLETLVSLNQPFLVARTGSLNPDLRKDRKFLLEESLETTSFMDSLRPPDPCKTRKPITFVY